MKSRKVLSMAMAAALSVGAFAVPASAATVGPENVLAKPTVKYDHKHGGAFDLGIANDERLIEMLKKEGKIKKNATPAEAEKALKSYLNARAENAGKTKDNLPKGLDAKIKDSNGKSTGNGLVNGNGNKLGQAKKNQPDGVTKEAYDGSVREDKVLVLAIDFPDYEKSSITEDETDMFYEDYTHEHFQDMIFGENGYEGPNGENLISMKQYYEEQSGGSYTVDGTVAGWYTADHPAAYYGGHSSSGGNDIRPRTLVYEALKKAGQDPSVNLSEYDAWDRYDYDGDGVYNEPDGIIDHLMVIHAGPGEEAGGGKLGEDAIWSHRWNLGGLIGVPGGTSNSDRFGGVLAAFDYTIEPEDGAAGVFSHEYGHDLGLPDEYDTQYSGAGEPVSYWSIMSSGSWAGKVPGTEPTGFSAWSKEFLQANHGGNWLSGSTVNLDDINSSGTEVLLDEAVTKGTNNDAVRINLPQKEVQGIQPEFGEKYYYSTKGDDLHTSLTTPEFDLTNATTATFDYKSLYEIEYDYDYLTVTAVTDSGEEVVLDVIGDEDTNGDGSAETTNGQWVDKSYDLSQFAGEKVTLHFNYDTDGGLALNGFAMDNASLTVDDNVVFSDDAEGDAQLETDGFTVSNGIDYKDHYYLLEWRSHNGVDEGLSNIRRGASLMSFDSGLVVWYVDNSYSDNWTGIHPGDGFLGVVDADQKANYWSDGAVASSRYQVHDAAFSLNKSQKMFLDYSDLFGITMEDNNTARNPLFSDSADYSNKGLVDAGRNVPNYGLNFRVTGESADGTVGKVLIYKK